MNIKLITKAMHTLSLLSEDDVQMVMKLRGLSEDERQMLMLVLEPGVKPSKKSSKKSVGGGGRKSQRASSLQSAIKSGVQRQEQPALCTYVSDNGDDPTQCGETENSGIHDATMGYRNYHEFQPPISVTAASGGGG